MFNIGAGEMILIALVLLIAVGPEQLPGVIRRTGKVVGQLKAMSDNLRRDFNSSLEEIERAADVKNWAGGELESTVESVKEAAVEPFRTDFEVDGSTKVTDMWSRPATTDGAATAESTDTPEPEEAAEVDEAGGDVDTGGEAGDHSLGEIVEPAADAVSNDADGADEVA